jgi:hypothetical protein
MKLIDRLIESFASGEVAAAMLAGFATWAYTAFRGRAERERSRETQLGRLEFRLENQQTTKEAVREGMAEIKQLLLPYIQEIKVDLHDLKLWVSKVDDKSDQALQLAQRLQASQRQQERYQSLLKEKKNNES